MGEYEQVGNRGGRRKRRGRNKKVRGRTKDCSLKYTEYVRTFRITSYFAFIIAERIVFGQYWTNANTVQCNRT